jgi:kynurenine formamidase
MPCDVGTHIDSPAHWYKGARDISQLTLDELTAPGAVIDCQAQCEANPTYLMTVDDVKKFEQTYGQIPPKSLIVMKTGWGSKFHDVAQYVDGGFPGFCPDLARFLVKERDIVGIGIDTASLDHSSSTDFMTHQVILSADKY